jgi:AAA15 family ATPase/GTPase
LQQPRKRLQSQQFQQDSKMYLKKISLFNYKNFSEANFEFDSKINCFVGKNGIGKTNVLDAIYHWFMEKSPLRPTNQKKPLMIKKQTLLEFKIIRGLVILFYFRYKTCFFLRSLFKANSKTVNTITNNGM